MTPAPRILGLGYAVPQQVRENDAPIFDWLRQHEPAGSKLFEGYAQRRVLSDGEELMDILLPAAQQALADAGIGVQDVDMLLGCASVSPYETPNELCKLHEALGLPERCWVLPLNNEFSNFNAALLMADGLVRAGRVRHVLIAVGGNWTRHVNYHTPQSVSAADGAGAAVVGLAATDDAGPRWEVIGHDTITQAQYYGSMYMCGERLEPAGGAAAQSPALWSWPWFHIAAEGLQGFKDFGGKVVPQAALQLLARHGIAPADAAFICHQASSVLLDAWQQAFGPGAQLVQTLRQFANMTVANIPVTLAWAQHEASIAKDHLVLLGLGPEMHVNALLLRR